MQVDDAGSWPSPAGSGLRWALATFATVALVGWIGMAACVRHACMAGAPPWLWGIVQAVFWLGAPWVLPISFVSPRLLKGPLMGAGVGLGAAVSLSLLVFLARYGYLRFRRFLDAPLPELQQHGSHPDDRHVPRPLGMGPLMLAAIVAWAAWLVMLVGREGMDAPSLRKAAFATLFLAAVLVLPLYFESRRPLRPDRMEIVLASAWVFFWRAVAGLTSLLLAIIGAVAISMGWPWTGAFFLLLGGVVAWWGWVGGGHHRGFADDLASHRSRRRRYGWK